MSFNTLMNVHIFDDVLSQEDFENYKKRVEFARFGDVISQNIKYSDISQDVSAEKLYAFVDKKFRPTIKGHHNNSKSIKSVDVLSFLRAYRNKPYYRHPMWIHSDALFADYIGIYFVQPSEFPQDDGFALWNNKELNNIQLETKNHLEEKNKIVDSQTLDPERWSMWNRVEFKENRLVIVPASYFHSTATYGHHGGQLDKCRIVHVLFFNEG